MKNLCFTAVLSLEMITNSTSLQATVDVNFADYQPPGIGSYWMLEDEFYRSDNHRILGTELIH